MRSARIFLIGVVGLVAVFTMQLWARWLALGLAAAPITLIVIGQFFLPRHKQSIRLWASPVAVKSSTPISFQLSGRQVTLDFFKRWYNFKIEVHNWWLLIMVALASLAAIALVWETHELLIPGALYYYAGILWLPVCFLGWRWFWERKIMRESELTLGTMRLESEGPRIWKRVRYHFTDNQGGHWGGSVRTLFWNTFDNLTIVFYDKANPQRCVTASAMMFHKLEWE